jgi:hypothetical protein
LSGTYFVLGMQQYLGIVISVAYAHCSPIAGTKRVQAVVAIVVAVVDAAQRVAEPTVRPKPGDVILRGVTCLRRQRGDVVVHGQS